MSLVRPLLRHALLVSLLCSGAVAASVVALAAPTPEPAGEVLEQSMRQMNSVMKYFRKGVTAENRDAALEQLTKFELAVVDAKAQVPHSAEAIEAAKRPAFMAEFRKSLIEALRVACDAEVALLDGKYDEANAIVGKLAAIKDAGHEKFNAEDGE